MALRTHPVRMWAQGNFVISQEKLELSPGIGVIPTFVFYVVLYMAIMRLQPIARDAGIDNLIVQS